VSTVRLVGLYADPAAIAADPGYLDVAQDEIGLNCIILGGPFDLSPQVRQLNPLGGPTDDRTPGLPPIVRHARTEASAGVRAPGLTLTDDDTTLRRAIDEAHKRGIQVWGIISAYWAGAEHAAKLMARDLYGRRLDAYPRHPFAHEQATHTFCPTHPQVNAWFEAALVDIAVRYDIQGYALTHFRFAHPAFFEQMLACACPGCERTAAELGYDFARMKAAVLGTVAALQKLPPATLRRWAGLSFGFSELLQMLGQDVAGVVDWFNFRADVISHNLKRFRDAVHAAVKRDFSFGSDAHYPSMAILVGHRYRDLAGICDHILPLLSHNEIHYLDNLATFATLLAGWINGLDEKDALRLVYRLFGVAGLGLPGSIAELHLGDPPSAETRLPVLGDIVAEEMHKARLLSGDRIPSYPVIKGSLWPEDLVRRLTAVAHEAGHDGIVYQGTSSLFPYPR